MRTLVGDTLWSKFSALEVPPADAIVPRQLVLLAHHALRSLKLQYDSIEAEQSARQLAEDTIVEVSTRIKRHRAA